VVGVVLTGLAMTWLNPHVYLDTVVLLGSLANEYHGGRWLFGVGAILASAIWFITLGSGARRLHGSFANPTSWRVLRTHRDHDDRAWRRVAAALTILTAFNTFYHLTDTIII
jgi:arginine exporter protein ArgO